MKQQKSMKSILDNRIVVLTALTITVMLFASCGAKGTHEEVMASYANGNPKTVFEVRGSGEKQERIGEKGFYEDKQLQYEKHYKDDKPTGVWKFYYADGTLFAEGDYTTNHEVGQDWKFFDADGNDLYGKEFDSMRVMEFTADNRPLSVAYYDKNEEMRYQFNDNYTLNARGKVVDGKKEGLWEFYYANGQLLLEARYLDGIENGAYNSYRENGVPYFRGFYINGSRANVWEIYDEAGNLVARQNYDE